MAVSLNRRDVLKGALGAFAAWTSSGVLSAQRAAGGVRLTDQIALADGGGRNVLASPTGEGYRLVDGGAPKWCDTVMSSFGANAYVHTLLHTHRRLDQCGHSERG